MWNLVYFHEEFMEKHENFAFFAFFVCLLNQTSEIASLQNKLRFGELLG